MEIPWTVASLLHHERMVFVTQQLILHLSLCPCPAKSAAMTLGPTILPVFEQLGMLDELQRFSLNVKPFVLRNEKMKIHGTVGLNGEKDM